MLMIRTCQSVVGRLMSWCSLGPQDGPLVWPGVGGVVETTPYVFGVPAQGQAESCIALKGAVVAWMLIESDDADVVELDRFGGEWASPRVVVRMIGTAREVIEATGWHLEWPSWAVAWSAHVLRAPWAEAEDLIARCPRAWSWYHRVHGGDR